MTTEQVRESLRHGQRGDLNHSIPVGGALETPESDLPIPPYVLGCWLGDGVSRTAQLTVSQSDVGHFRKMFAGFGELLGEPAACSAESSAPAYPITKGRYRGDLRGFRCRLDKNSLLRNKHIPQEYFRASREQRLELLAGLMDTDGCIKSRGNQAVFASTRQCLAEGVSDLVQSLGARCSFSRGDAKIDGRFISHVWYVHFFPFEGCVSLPRKSGRMRMGQRGWDVWC